MKYRKYLFFLTYILSASLFIGCGGDDDDNGLNIGDGCSTEFKVNGDQVEINDLAFCSYFDNNLTISASLGGGEFLLAIDPISSSGTYSPNVNNDPTVVISLEYNNMLMFSSNVQINVSQISSSGFAATFDGTFFEASDFNQTNPFDITEGKVSANF